MSLKILYQFNKVQGEPEIYFAANLLSIAPPVSQKKLRFKLDKPM